MNTYYVVKATVRYFSGNTEPYVVYLTGVPGRWSGICEAATFSYSRAWELAAGLSGEGREGDHERSCVAVPAPRHL
jgi:hypothetical protein